MRRTIRKIFPVRILKHIFPEKEILIESISPDDARKECLMNEELFMHIDPLAHEWHSSLKGAEAGEVQLEVWQVLKNKSCVSKIFEELGRGSLKSLCLQQSQIARFIRVYGHSEIMKDCRATMFLTEVDDEVVVIEFQSFPEMDRLVPQIFSTATHHAWRLVGGPTRRLQIVVPK
ncbi:MAG: hypothetical protein WCO21_02550 [bacterium]|nr:hypothetical protein [Candidatus Jorgensenbacteria bacterium]